MKVVVEIKMGGRVKNLSLPILEIQNFLKFLPMRK